MAKVPFSKIETKLQVDKKELIYCNSKNEEIVYEVKTYLPFKEKLEVVSNIINYSIDENNFYNPMRVKLYTALEVVYAYTNLSFTEKMKEDPFKIYDIIINSGIFEKVIETIGDEWKAIQEDVNSTIKNIYDYKNSAMGIMEMITSDYSDLNLDAQNIQKALGDPQNLTLLKDVMTKLG